MREEGKEGRCFSLRANFRNRNCKTQHALHINHAAWSPVQDAAPPLSAGTRGSAGHLPCRRGHSFGGRRWIPESAIDRDPVGHRTCTVRACRVVSALASPSYSIEETQGGK